MLWMIQYGDKDVNMGPLGRPNFITIADYKFMRQQGLIHVENYYTARLTKKALNRIQNG